MDDVQSGSQFYFAVILATLVTFIAFESSLQSQAAQVFAAMTITSITRNSGVNSRPALEPSSLSESLAIYGIVRAQSRTIENAH
jgi:hypothetical protein